MTGVRSVEVMQAREVIASPNFSHARHRRWCGVDQVLVYHRDPLSPSGVLLANCTADPAIIDPLLRELRNTSALSPTEGL